ncbi:uncharacterized protein [Parasteatoda tepidariorum]|uniref:uncharacterized protein isoform X2 n=1 Tax=Parasteatoda tepidariorum TaxID=114398 RepID=UPI001C71B24F|nr:uncharacterized protein LOC107454981 isoform X2 [Parasteatoda tepidariorum]
MSNQRSCILFIALVVILLYLYYESIPKKELNKTKEKLLNENFSSYKMLKDEPKVLFGRQLLSYSTENAEDPSQKEISSHSTKFFQFRTLNTFPDTDHKNKVKRIKRNARIRKSIYKWKFNISLSKLDDEFTKQTDNLKNSVNENQREEESLNVEIYIDGKTKQFKNLEHSWHVVKESLRNFYKEPNEPRSQDALNFLDFSSQTSSSQTEESTKSSKDFFSLTVQNSSENLIREETKKISSSSRGREAKFLFLDFGGGGNKENPPILSENGENMINKVTPTESMHDLSFFNSTEQFDIKIVNGGVFSSTLLPEHQKLDLPLPEPNLQLTSPETTLDSTIKATKPNTPNPTFSSNVLNCNGCVVQEMKSSTELQTVADRKTDATNNVMQTNIPINVIDISPDSIQMFCRNFVQSLRKSPRVEDESAEFGSGHLDAENNMEILKETEIGSGSFDVDKFESLRVTTPTVATLKTSQQQLGLLQRLWNIIPNFRSRNQRNLVSDDLEISGFPKDFSVQDCKDLFTNQIKSEFSTLQNIEKTTLSETKSISLFPPDNLISETENRSRSSFDFIEKTGAVKVDEITTRTASDIIVQFQNKPSFEELSSSIFQTVPSFHDQIKTADKSEMINIVPFKQTKSIGEVNEITSIPTPELFVPFQNKPSVSESTSNVFQNIPSFHDQSMITDKSDMVDFAPVKQTESVSNLEKITVTEGFSLKVEDSGEQQKVSRSTVVHLMTTSTASPLIESLIGLSTESSISLNAQTPNIISSEIPEDLKIIPSERIIQEDKKIFFSDLNNDDVLELGSSDERIISDTFTTIDEIELKEVTLGQNTFISERRFIPNFFSGGSGARDLPESFISTDTNTIKNELSLPNTNVQSVFDNPFLEEGNALKTTVDFIQEPMIDEERRFIPNFFNAGSGARELPEFGISSDVTSYEKEIVLSGTNVQSVTSGIFLDDSSEKTVNFMQTPVTNDGRRFIPNFFSEGSGARELQELHNTTVSDGIFVEELSEKEISKNYILINNNNEFSSLEPFDVGSGERKLDEVTIDTKNLDNNFPDNVSPPESVTSSSDGLINEKIITKINTDPPVYREIFMNDTGSVEFVDPRKDNSDQNSIFQSSERTEYSLTTQKPCINCSNVSLEKSKSQVDTIFLTPEETPSENKQPSNETEVAQAVVSFSQDSDVASSTFSNSNKKNPIFADLLTEIDVGKQDKNKIYLEPEPEMSVQSFKPTEPSRTTELNDDPPPDSFYFSLKPEATDISSKSKITDSVIVDSSGGETDPINSDKIHLKPEPEISSGSLTRRRGARFDISPTDMPGFTSKRETTVSEVQMSLRPTQSVNLFQSRRGARGHDLFDLEKLDSEATLSISKEETESGTSEAVEEAANSLTGAKTKRTLNHTLTVEDEENGATESINLSKPFEALFTEMPGNKNKFFTTLFSDNSSMTDSISPASSTKEMQSTEVNLNPELPSPKFCESASECNVSLNERCMPKDDILICNCGKAFRRNLKTKKCEATITLQTSITLPGERFYEDLRDINTQLYKQKKRDYIRIMWYLLRHNPKLFHTVAEVDITGFEEGSLIVNYTMKLLDNGNETASELAQQLQEDLSKIINEQEQLKNASLEFKNASVSTLVLNPCLSSDMNYCHKNAFCIQTEEKGFKCQCKADYLDNSRDKRYPGENCTGICDASYCGDHGKCYLKDLKQKQCRCEGWYLGERCEINGIVVIASFAFASFLIIAVVVLFVFYCKKNRNRKFYNRNFQPGQEPPTTGDSLELEQAGQHCRMSKFLAVSTPLYEAPNPTIQVTSPSFTGSSIDYDSTFDRTPYDSEVSIESGIAPKV